MARGYDKTGTRSGLDWYKLIGPLYDMRIVEPTGWDDLHHFVYVEMNHDEFERRLAVSNVMYKGGKLPERTGMARLEIPRDLFHRLTRIASSVETQDNRATAKPYFFQIMEEQRIYGIDEQYGDKFIWQYKHDSEWQYEPDNLSEDFIEDDYDKIYYTTVQTYRNCFLTEWGAKSYIANNKYNLTNPSTYLSYADRNKELAAIFEFLKHCVVKKDMSSNEELEKGKAIIRREGMNFESFIDALGKHVINSDSMNHDSIVELYNSYASLRSRFRFSVEDYFKEHFQLYTIEEHGMRLRTK